MGDLIIANVCARMTQKVLNTRMPLIHAKGLEDALGETLNNFSLLVITENALRNCPPAKEDNSTFFLVTRHVGSNNFD